MKYLIKIAIIALFGFPMMTKACWIGDYSIETDASNPPTIIADFGIECPEDVFYSLTPNELVGGILKLVKMKDINLTLRNFTNDDARSYVFPILEGMIQNVEDYVQIPKIAVQPPLNHQFNSQTQILTQSFSQVDLTSSLEEILEELKNARVEWLAKKEVEKAIEKADASQKRVRITPEKKPNVRTFSDLLDEEGDDFVTAVRQSQLKRPKHEDKSQSLSRQPSHKKLATHEKRTLSTAQLSSEKSKVNQAVHDEEDYISTPPLIPPKSRERGANQRRETFSQYIRQFQYQRHHKEGSQ